MPHADPSPPAFRRKPTRAETARANGAPSRGPVTDDGKHHSSMNALTHGLRARRHLAVPALGEDPAEIAAHFAAARAELGATGPVARHLAETVGGALIRSTRADRMEGELLAGLAEGGASVAKALHADRDARATLALVQRYRREADADLRRSLDSLLRLHRARADGLLPNEEEAAEAQATLDEIVADLPEPSEPRIEKIEPPQPLGRNPANDDAAPASPAPAVVSPERRGAGLLLYYQVQRGFGEERGTACWARFTEEERALALAAAEAERRAKAEGRDPESLHAKAAPLAAPLLAEAS